MKTIQLVFTTLFLLLSTMLVHAQDRPTAAVLDIHTQGLHATPAMAGNLLRLELRKTGAFRLLDKFDVEDQLRDSTLTTDNCYGKACLLEVGKAINVDKMISGSVLQFGKKIVIELKVIDVKTGTLEATEVNEFLNVEAELQNMIMISVNNLIGLENDKTMVDNLIFYQSPVITPTTKSKNSGMRMGMTYIGGETGERLGDPIADGGYDSYPIISQFGYQTEVEYLSAGNFQALGEGLFLIGGLEQQMFVPSVTLMNGFRHKERGWEFAFGPSFSLKRSAKGFFDAEGVLGEAGAWHLENDWNIIGADSMAVPNPNVIVERMDKRGDIKLHTTWVWAIGRTFHSGYLNIPVNLYVAPNRDGWHYGISMGFNVRRKDS